MANNSSDNEAKLLVALSSNQDAQDQLKNYRFNRNNKLCRSKIKRPREKFPSYKDKLAGSGAAASSKPPKVFAKMDEVLGTRPQTRSTFLLDSENFEHDGESTCSELNQCPKKIKTCHKQCNFHYAVENFKDVLSRQHEENLKLTTAFQQQWLDLEKQRFEAKQEEKERQQHEISMMQLYCTMVNQGVMQVPQQNDNVPSTSQHHQPTYTDKSHSSPSTNDYLYNFHFK